MIKKTEKKIDQIKYSSFNDDGKNYLEIDIDYFFLNDLCQRDLFNHLIQKIAMNNDKLCLKLFNTITKNDVAIQSFLDLINIYISENIEKTVSIMRIINIIIDSSIPKHKLINICANQLINVALIPENRDNYTFISFLIDKLCYLDEIPLRTTHIIGLSLIHNPEQNLSKIITICKKIGEKNLSNIMNVLDVTCKKIFSNINIPTDLILSLFETIPSLINSNNQIIPFLLKNYAKKYNQGNNVIDMICLIFNKMTPEREEDQLIVTNDEIDLSMNESSKNVFKSSNNDMIIRQIPQNLIETNPQFWNLFDEYKYVINDIIVRNNKNMKKFKCLIDFPELISFEFRMSLFRKEMNSKINKYSTNYLNINHTNILFDSYNQLAQKSHDEWLQKISVEFKNERGIDAGGLTKEWFTLVIKEIFNPHLALFQVSQNNGYQPNPFSSINPEHIDYFRFAGKLVARALIQGQYVGAHLTRSFRRQILHNQIKLKDYEDIDKEIYNSMIQILNEDVEPLCLTFTILDDEYGIQKVIPLKENGENIDVTNENIDVTNENKKEYISLYINYKLRKSIQNQINAFCEGFNWLIPHDEIKMFSQSELDLLICGIPKIDINDLKKNTEYDYPYNKDHPVIKMFFKAISKWNSDDLAKLLLFFTGSSQVPVNGFKSYKESGNPIKIGHIRDKNKFCQAHTCFNKLDLPEYESEDELNTKLLISIQVCEYGFA